MVNLVFDTKYETVFITNPSKVSLCSGLKHDCSQRTCEIRSIWSYQLKIAISLYSASNQEVGALQHSSPLQLSWLQQSRCWYKHVRACTHSETHCAHFHIDKLCLVPQGQASVPLKVVAIKNIILQLSQTWWICTSRAVRHNTYNQQYVTFFPSCPSEASRWCDIITRITNSSSFYFDKIVYTCCWQRKINRVAIEIVIIQFLNDKIIEIQSATCRGARNTRFFPKTLV